MGATVGVSMGIGGNPDIAVGVDVGVGIVVGVSVASGWAQTASSNGVNAKI